jgi:hypothetical protein
VFNFFSPFYAPPGEIRSGGYVAPELEIATEYQNTLVTNFFLVQAFTRNSSSTEAIGENLVVIDITEEEAVAADSQALVDLVADKLLGGEISATLEQEVIGMVDRIAATDVATRAAEAIYLIAGSPEFAYQN